MMAGSSSPARRITVWECTCQWADCGHVWIAKSKPGKCAKCKRRSWETGTTVMGRPSKTRQNEERLHLSLNRGRM